MAYNKVTLNKADLHTVQPAQPTTSILKCNTCGKAMRPYTQSPFSHDTNCGGDCGECCEEFNRDGTPTQSRLDEIDRAYANSLTIEGPLFVIGADSVPINDGPTDEIAELERMLRKAEEELASIPDIEIVPEPTHHISPRNYQLEDVAFHSAHPKSANQSQPGIGKTFIATETQIAVDARNILVSCPNYLGQQWVDFITAQYPQSQNVVYYATGAKLTRIEALVQPMMPINAGMRVWVIINHQMLRTYPIPPIYDSLIIDESHHFANRDAKMTKAMIALAQQTPRILQLTATPVRKEPDDLYAQLVMLDPTHPDLKSYHAFVSKYCYVTSGRFGVHVRGGRTKMIQELLTNYAVAHTYASVHLQLPKLIEYTDNIPLSPEVAKQYNATRLYYRYQDLIDGSQAEFLTSAMSVMSHLRKITMCEDKLEAILDILTSQNEPAVIFTWHREAAEKVAAYLSDNLSDHPDVPVINGSIPVAMRAELAKSQKYVVATLASLSEGVDLSHARTVIFAEEYWQPALMFQALSRVRRWSNDNRPVLCHYLIATLPSTTPGAASEIESIDAVIHHAHKERHTTIESIMKKILDD